jgi:hypothetical protein
MVLANFTSSISVPGITLRIPKNKDTMYHTKKDYLSFPSCNIRKSSVFNGDIIRVKNFYIFDNTSNTLTVIDNVDSKNQSYNIEFGALHTLRSNDHRLVVEYIDWQDGLSWEDYLQMDCPSWKEFVENCDVESLNTTVVGESIASFKKRLNLYSTVSIGHNCLFEKLFTKSKFFFIDQLAHGIPLNYLVPAWVITVDKFQGRQNENIILALSPNDGHNFTREHGYVAMSRVKQFMLITGNIDELYFLSMKPKQPRQIDLEWRLIQSLLPYNNTLQLFDETTVSDKDKIGEI